MISRLDLLKIKIINKTIFYSLIILLNVLFSKDKWKVSADLLEWDKINNIKIQRLNNNVKLEKDNKILTTDYALQDITNDIIHLNGNTKMINNLDTLTCDSMVYWSSIDSIYAYGNIQFVHGSERGITGEEMEVLYSDTLLKKIRVINDAFAYNNLNVRINKSGPQLFFRDEMSSNEMVAYFDNEYFSKLELINMAVTSYHIIEDSILVGNNISSGDTIIIDFKNNDINRIQIQGGSKGKFKPEENNSNIDSIIIYGAEYIDYQVNDQLTFLIDNAYVNYQKTELKAGKIIANWETNILDAFKINNQVPTVQTNNDAPMQGEKMVFDLIANHGRIIRGKTEFENGIYHGKEVFRDDPNLFHVNKSKYTSCDLDTPHFYLASNKMKLIPNERVIAKPLWLHIYDIPIIGLPMAVFPNKGGARQSGWIMPSFDSYKSIGTGFRNFGYYWAPNEFMDQKILVNFFDEEGININSSFKYKKRNGFKWYDFQYNGSINSTYKRRLDNSAEILDLTINKNFKEDYRLIWNHNQKFDPTQRLAIKYEFISNKDSYNNIQEISLQNRLKQNLSSSVNYNKNWKSSSFSIGFNNFRDLSIENSTPNSIQYLNQNRYKTYKYLDGPKFNFRAGNKKIFGLGDKWFHSLSSTYSLKASLGRKEYWLIKKSDSEWSSNDTLNLKHGGIKHSIQINMPQTFFSWLKISPSISIREDWIFNYKKYNLDQEIQIDGFKRRLTWNGTMHANTKIYGLFPFEIGRLNAIRHIITPSIRFEYQPNFSATKWGGKLYFQDLNENQDYFKGSYVGATSKKERKTYTISINNDFQAKLKENNGGYKKLNFLTWNSSISYDAYKDSINFSDISSTIRFKNLSGNELFYIKMSHNIYHYDENNKKIVNEYINLLDGKSPRLTYIDIQTDAKLNLFGSKINNSINSTNIDSTNNIDNEFYLDQESIDKGDVNNIWETKLQFKYSTNWRYKQDWETRFSLKTINKIKLSKHWVLSYIADFNIKDREMIYHSLRVYRPLHCWEFSFNYWPRGASAGFSLKINVKNPDLQDIKVTSKSSNRGFGDF